MVTLALGMPSAMRSSRALSAAPRVSYMAVMVRSAIGVPFLEIGVIQVAAFQPLDFHPLRPQPHRLANHLRAALLGDPDLFFEDELGRDDAPLLFSQLDGLIPARRLAHRKSAFVVRTLTAQIQDNRLDVRQFLTCYTASTSCNKAKLRVHLLGAIRRWLEPWSLPTRLRAHQSCPKGRVITWSEHR